MNKIKVLLIEDDPFWQESIKALINLHKDIELVQILSTKDEALTAKLCGIDVVLLDIGLTRTELDGIEVAKSYYEKGYENIIMLTSFNEHYIIAKAFEHGAMNYITKSSCADIPQYIRDTFHRRIFLHSDVSKIMINQFRNERKLRVLTPTEREIYDLRERGMNRAEIANYLFKSVETVKKQIKKIQCKIKQQ